MRIPPAVAKEIGGYYATAHANDDAAAALAKSSDLLTQASRTAAGGDTGSAIADASIAGTLLMFTTHTYGNDLSGATRTSIDGALQDARTATDLLRQGNVDAALPTFASAVSVIGNAIASATETAASARSYAEQLAAEYL